MYPWWGQRRVLLNVSTTCVYDHLLDFSPLGWNEVNQSEIKRNFNSF